MYALDVLLRLGDLNWVLIIATGIWFSAVCLIKMVETAIRLNLGDE